MDQPHAQPRPSRAQLQDWRTFLRAHAYVLRRLEADLLAAGHPPLAMYDVLVQLSEAPDRRLRMVELADAVLLSRSGLTRLVDRMEAEGYVRREPSPDDARGIFAVMTDEGLSTLRAASRTHLAGISEHVVDRLTPSDLAGLGVACLKMLPEAPPHASQSHATQSEPAQSHPAQPDPAAS